MLRSRSRSCLTTCAGLALAATVGIAFSARAGEVPAAAPLPDLVTLDDALTIFRKRGFDLLIADAAVASAEGDVKIAGAVYNPGVSLGIGHTFNYDPVQSGCQTTGAGSANPNGDGCSSNVFNVGVTDNAAIMDVVAGKRGLRLDVAHAALKAARLSRVDAQRNLEFQVKQQYFVALEARALRDFAVEVAKGANQIFQLNDLRYKAGAISEADVAKVETAKLEADQALDAAEQTLRQSKVGLAFFLGVRGAVPDFSVDVDLIKFHVPQKLASASRDKLLDEAFAHRPDVQQLAAQMERASASIAQAHRQLVPDLALSLGYTQEGVAPSSIQPPTLSLSVSGNLPIIYRQEGEIAKAEADLTTQRLSRAKAETQVSSDVEQAWVAYQTQRKLVERMESRLLDRAKRARDLVAVQYQKGAASLLEFLDAQRTYIATNGEYYQDLTGYWTAVFQLEQAVGMDLR